MAKPRLHIKIENLAGLKAKLRALDEAGEAAIRREVRRSLVKIENDAKRWAPRSRRQPPVKDPSRKTTGLLRRSITHQVNANGLGGVVGTNTPYAPYQEFGTRRIPPRPFLKPAFDKERPKFVQRLARELHRAQRKASRR